MKRRSAWSEILCRHLLPASQNQPPVLPSAMKTILLHILRPRSLVLAGALLFSCSASASDRLYIPPPPSPEKVVHDIRTFFHRLPTGVKDPSKQPGSPIRDRSADEDEAPPPRPPRIHDRGAPPPDSESLAHSKDAVPYRYDDADTFDGRMKPDPAGGRS